MLGVASFAGFGDAHAVPCDTFDSSATTLSPGDGLSGVYPASACANGIGANDSAAVLNNNSYFGIDTWERLDRAGVASDPSEGSFSDTVFWSGTPDAPAGATEGTFTLDEANTWALWENLVVVLKGGRVSSDPDIFWAAYSLIPGTLDHSWRFVADSNRELSHMTLYAANPRSQVPEPSVLMLLAVGLLGWAAALRRRAWGRDERPRRMETLPCAE